MNFDYSSFIYEDFCDKEYDIFFDKLIEEFENLIEEEKVSYRNLEFVEDENIFIFDDAYSNVRNIIKPHLKKYADLVKYRGNIHVENSCKMQKSHPRDGYHEWHHERCSNINETAMSIREFTWTLYLNDVKEGGETEFLLQSKRVSPEKGKICIWPASFTHLHRGNPPLKEVKYILTGWTFTSNFISMN
jgi:hypothetical protein